VRNTKRIAKFALPSALICHALYRPEVHYCAFVVLSKGGDNGHLLLLKVDAIIFAFCKLVRFL